MTLLILYGIFVVLAILIDVIFWKLKEKDVLLETKKMIDEREMIDPRVYNGQGVLLKGNISADQVICHNCEEKYTAVYNHEMTFPAVCPNCGAKECS